MFTKTENGDKIKTIVYKNTDKIKKRQQKIQAKKIQIKWKTIVYKTHTNQVKTIVDKNKKMHAK